MSKKTITVCDSCDNPIDEEKDKYEIDKISLKTQNKIWEGGHRSEHRVIDLDFCESCAKEIKKSLENIEEGLRNSKENNMNEENMKEVDLREKYDIEGTYIDCINCGKEKIKAKMSDQNVHSGVDWTKWECPECGIVFIFDFQKNEVLIEEPGDGDDEEYGPEVRRSGLYPDGVEGE